MISVHVWVNCSASGHKWRFLFTRSDGNRADNDAILQHHAKHQEDKVEQEHGEAQTLIHLPLTGCNGDDDKNEHDKEQHDGTEEPITADGDWSQTVNRWVQEPRDRQALETKRHKNLSLDLHFLFNRDTWGKWSLPHSDVEDVTAHRAGYSHVPHAFTSYNHTGNEVRDGCPCSQDSQAHNLLWDADSLTNLQRQKQSSEWIETTETAIEVTIN